MSNKKEISWTKGTDKPYGEVVYEYWSNEMGHNPNKKQLRRLRNEMMSREAHIKEIREELERSHRNVYSGIHKSLDTLELLELNEEALGRLKELYREFSDYKLSKETMKRIKSFARTYTNNEEAAIIALIELERMKDNGEITFQENGKVKNKASVAETIIRAGVPQVHKQSLRKKWIPKYAQQYWPKN
jgi:hypothetical protein